MTEQNEGFDIGPPMAMKPVGSALSTTGDLSNPVHRAAVLANIEGGMLLLKEMMQSILVKGTDYGLIPGTPRPSLWQPGAEKIARALNLVAKPVAENIHEDWEAGIFAYTYRMDIVNQEGALLGSAIATCSSEETQYKKAHTDRVMYGKTLEAVAPAQQRETLMLMAQKRAFVAAIRRVSAASEIFSQDDDIVQDTSGGSPASQQVPVVVDSNSLIEEMECPIHRGEKFFKAGRMRDFAHPTGPKGSSAPWCNRKEVIKEYNGRANAAIVDMDDETKQKVIEAATLEIPNKATKDYEASDYYKLLQIIENISAPIEGEAILLFPETEPEEEEVEEIPW